MRLFIAEKPELARAIADAISTTTQEKNNGYIKIKNDYISWCFGHLLTLKEPHEYNQEYKKWNIEHLPLNISKLQLKPIDGKENPVDFREYKLDTAIQSKAFNNDNITAHHGIIPTLNNINVEELKEEELNIYKLIAQRYLLQFMQSEIIEKTIYIATNNTYDFKYVFSTIKSLGFKEVYKDVEEKVDKVDNLINKDKDKRGENGSL